METTSREKIYISSLPTPSPRKRRSGFLKRAFDILASGLGLLLLAPLFGLLAIAIKRDSPGPVFYRGPRLGLGGKSFGILKFRTMREEAASYDGPRITAEGDPRITPLGKWLRDTKLNELPQLWNVLVGEMSLVGPRPEDPLLAESWPRELREEMLSLRPGITSPASVLFRDEEKMLSASGLMEDYLGSIQPSKLRLDQLYIRHRSFLLDLDVLLWTFLVVMAPNLRQKQPPEEYLFWGPISRLGRKYVNWFVLDTLITLAAFALVGVAWRLMVGPLDVGLLPAFLVAVGFSILFSLIAALSGVQDISWSSASAREAAELILPTFLAGLVSVLVNRWQGFLPDHIIVDAALVAFLGYLTARYRSRLLTGLATRWVSRRGGRPALRERVLIVGAGETGQYAAWRMSHGQAGTHFQVVGFADDDMFRQGARVSGYNVVGKSRDIPALVARFDVGLVVFAIHRISRVERAALLKTCRDSGARVITWPDMPGLLRDQVHRQPTDAATGRAAWQVGMGEEHDGTLGWLDALEADLSLGDYSAALERIHDLRQALECESTLEETREA